MCPLKPLFSLTWSVTADAERTLLLQGDSTWPGAQLTVTPPCHLLHIPVLLGAIWGQEAGAGAGVGMGAGPGAGDRQPGDLGFLPLLHPRTQSISEDSVKTNSVTNTPDPRGPTVRAPDVPCC